MVNIPSLPGSPERTATFAPAGSAAGIAAHFKSAPVNMTCSAFVIGFSSSAKSAEQSARPTANSRMDVIFFMRRWSKPESERSSAMKLRSDALQLRTAMKRFALALLVLCPLALSAEEVAPDFDAKAAQRFADLALACVAKEYPNKISHLLTSDADVAPPRKLTPAFYGCYDWHSSAHRHWLLVRLVKTFPHAPRAQHAREALRKTLTTENLKQEAAYLRGDGRASFERPYGMAWLVQLVVELAGGDGPPGRGMLHNS